GPRLSPCPRCACTAGSGSSMVLPLWQITTAAGGPAGGPTATQPAAMSTGVNSDAVIAARFGCRITQSSCYRSGTAARRPIAPAAASSTQHNPGRIPGSRADTSSALAPAGQRVFYNNGYIKPGTAKPMIDFEPGEEQQMLVDTTRAFVERELMPHEETLERTGRLPPELAAQMKARSMELGLYACNMPEEVGGGGLDCVSLTLVEKELGRTSLALAECAHRPLNILAACTGEQVGAFLEPVMRGDKRDCIAMTEPGAGSDLRGMQCRAVRD